MDKSWISLRNRFDPRFVDGLIEFIKFAYTNRQPNSEIKCPCKRCRLSINVSKKTVYEHVIMYGFLETYTNWDRHGEIPSHQQVPNVGTVVSESNIQDDMEGLIHDTFGHRGLIDDDGSGDSLEDFEGPNEETKKFFNLLENARSELYPGCKTFSRLSFIVRMMHTKSLGGWSNKSFTMQLQQLKAAYHPDDDTFPSSYYDARKLVKDLGLDYKKIHACVNDCMIFTDASIHQCLKCGAPRYKCFEGQIEDEENSGRKIPVKVVRYFPLKPRLQRLYMSSKTAKSMRWHAEERTKDGILRHPADSLAWKTLDEKYPDFAGDCRNVRLALASDGFNPFKTMSVAHSTWPVVLIPYNLPPWMCMKQPYFMLTLLIDGPSSPGNNIDVYLQLVVDALKELWNDGVDTYDAASNQIFRMHAALLWTINDFPAYANLSGWSTKGKFACPVCNIETRSQWLKHGKKFCYMGHRRFLDPNHKFRGNKVSFDGTCEHQLKPQRLSGDELLLQLQGMSTEFGKSKCIPSSKKRRGTNSVTKRKKGDKGDSWKKKSVFFELPYWKDLLIRHNIDIMHTEKNICDKIVYTLLDVTGKSKDNYNARLDLEELGLRKALHLDRRDSDTIYIPPMSYALSKEKKDIFLKVLQDVKFPDGYASYISRCVKPNERNISGLKSHDCHILIEQLLPLCIRRVLPNKVCKALIPLCNCLRLLHSKVSRPSDFEALQDQIALTLCHLEIIFPPSFFDVMVHLAVHLPEEAMIAGPVQYRSMSSIERYLGTLKGYVRNRSRPEGSIAEEYLSEECMTFCSMYLDDMETKLNRPARNDDVSGCDSCEGLGRPIGKVETFRMEEVPWIQAHRYVLFNTDGIDPFRMAHKNELKRVNSRANEFEIDKNHNLQFHKWFKNHIADLEKAGKDDDVPINLKLIANCPDKWAKRYSGYIINGFRFLTKQRERMRKTQNSGVQLRASTQSFSSRKDKNPISGDVTYYGQLRDIIEIRYTNDLKFVLFKCDWVDNNRGIMEDIYKLTIVNFNHLLYQQNRLSDEPFILASQAEQVWYVQDPIDQDWNAVMKFTPRDLFEMGDKELGENGSELDVEPNVVQQLDDTIFEGQEDATWVGEDIAGDVVEVSTSRKRKDRSKGAEEEEQEEEEEEEEGEEEQEISNDDDSLYQESEEDDCFSDQDI